MFAAGSGVTPFLGFVAARTGPGENRLYLAIMTPAEFPVQADLDAAAAAGRLKLSVCFSRADAAVSFDGQHHVVQSGPRRRVDDVIRAEAETLWDLLRSADEGGRGAFVYVCGTARFAVAVREALAGIVPGDGGEFLRQLVADGRLGEDVFTTYLGHAQEGRRLEVSELAIHNDPGAPCWMAIGGAVFDVSEFQHLHIGGAHIIRNHAGLDATAPYRKVLHHAHPEIDAQLAMYEIGHLRRLDFGDRWGVVLAEDGLHAISLEELFRAWVRFVYLLVGMENALNADYAFTAMVTTLGEDAQELTPFKAQYVMESHRRFLISYLDGLVHDDLRNLWRLTAGFCDPHLDIRSFDTDLAAILASPEVALVRSSVGPVKEQLLANEDFGRVAAICRNYAHADVALLRQLKNAMLEGIRAFEAHEADVVEQAGGTVLNAARQTLDVLTAYYQRLAEYTRGHGIAAGEAVEGSSRPTGAFPGTAARYPSRLGMLLHRTTVRRQGASGDRDRP
jgi:cytochrome b involved in lipid metabolism